MKEILLTRGYKTVVDNEDYEELSKYKWYPDLPFGRVVRNVRNVKGNNSRHMARVIMNAPGHLQVDHINGDGFDNRRKNLRVCTKKENSRNQKLQQGCSSIYKGVNWVKNRNKWRSRIKVDGYEYSLGSYTDERQAALFYDIAAVHFFGEFAWLNFPEQLGFIKDYWRGKEAENERLIRRESFATSGRSIICPIRKKRT